MISVRSIVLCVIMCGLLGGRAEAQFDCQKTNSCMGQSLPGAAKNAFWTVHDKFQEDCKMKCTAQCKERWRKLVAAHKRENILQEIHNTPACSN